MKKSLLLIVSAILVLLASTAVGATKNKEEIPSRMRSTKRGYFGMIEVGEGFVMSTDGVYRTSLHVINGYRIFPQLSVGLGVGLKMFHGGRPAVLNGLADDNLHNAKTEVSLPLFFHVRTDILKNAKVSPYVALNAGYNVPLNKGFFRGYLIEPTIGIGLGVGKKGNQLNIGVGYQMHEIIYRVRKTEYSGYGGYIRHDKWVTEKEMRGAVNIMLGFMW